MDMDNEPSHRAYRTFFDARIKNSRCFVLSTPSMLRANDTLVIIALMFYSTRGL